MKSSLQCRAERAAEQFDDKARSPIVIEFAGVPKAGKTTTLTHVQSFLKRCGFRTDVVVERASVCPIRDKKHANFNVWTACTTLAQILEKTQNPPRPDDPQILFLDRGLFDSICWMTMMERISRIRPRERKVIHDFLTIEDWRKRISAVFVMLTSPQDAMKRERGLLPVEGAAGSIMNEDILTQIRNTTIQCINELEKDFRVYRVDTSDGETKDNPMRTAEVVAETIHYRRPQHSAPASGASSVDTSFPTCYTRSHHGVRIHVVLEEELRLANAIIIAYESGARCPQFRVLRRRGLRFPPDFPTWGRLLFDGANFISITPARVLWPGLAISLTCLEPTPSSPSTWLSSRFSIGDGAARCPRPEMPCENAT